MSLPCARAMLLPLEAEFRDALVVFGPCFGFLLFFQDQHDVFLGERAAAVGVHFLEPLVERVQGVLVRHARGCHHELDELKLGDLGGEKGHKHGTRTIKGGFSPSKYNFD